nr:glycosyl hydrolase [Micromonospora sp. DSM 115978]
AHSSSTPVGAFELYPGDEYVDVIGIDSYDHYPPSPTIESFVRQCNGPEGLCRVIAFARSRNKLFSVPEWGVVGIQGTRAGAAGQAGGDNPVYIREMHRIFTANADILAYEAYFNDDSPGNVHSSLNHPVRHPQSSAVYQQLW